MNKTSRVAVVGATGYAGFELACLLLRHPNIAKPSFFLRATTNGNGKAAPAARCLAEIFPQLRGWGEAPCHAYSPDAVAHSGAQIVFLATPHEASLDLAAPLLDAGLRVVDLSGAFRFRDAEVFSHWYKLHAAPQPLLDGAVYGLPEIYANELPRAKLVANPGCYATSVILGLRPLLDAGWIDRRRGIVCDCKSGASGAGKEPRRDLHFVEVDENFRAYGLFTHRHTPEIAQQLGLGSEELMFSTHLLPISRGILSTMYVWLAEPRTAEEIESLYRTAYAGRPMVRVSPAGTLPEVQHVARTNFCDIGFALDSTGTRLVVVSCLDNLGKGAAGQAVQNMNAMLGFAEATALI